MIGDRVGSVGSDGATPSAALLEVWQNGRFVTSVPLGGRALTVGRSPANDVCIREDRVSRQHAVIEQVGQVGWRVTDLCSRNGTFVNGRRIGSDRPLRPNDRVRIGETELVYRGPLAVSEPRTVAGEESALPTLTARERQVLDALCRPLLAGAYAREATTAEIAQQLCVGEAAVRQHLIHLCDKFRIDERHRERRHALAVEAIRRGAARGES